MRMLVCSPRLASRGAQAHQIVNLAAHGIPLVMVKVVELLLGFPNVISCSCPQVECGLCGQLCDGLGNVPSSHSWIATAPSEVHFI